VSTENNCASFLGKLINFFLDDIAIYRVKATERFIKDDEFRFM
jgi:hypothetical protein